MSFLTITISMFLIMNSVGHIMGYLDLVATLDERRRQKIIIREMLIALLLMLFFHFVGEFLLRALDVSSQTISFAGGLILFLIAIRMIFPQSKAPVPPAEAPVEPFIFPIATPMIAGPSILTTIMLLAFQDQERYKVISAILIAWAFSITILLFAQKIKDLVGRRTLIALERLMGLLLTMMAVEMLLQGLKSVINEGIA
jgi:multiple antibiotic resistance protein